LPGFGQSEKRAPGAFPYTREAFSDILADLLSALEIDRAHVAGHSMGGAIALTFAADHPDRLMRLAVIDSACYDFPLPWKGRLPLTPVVGSLIFKRLYGRGMFRDYFRNEVFGGRSERMDLARVDAYYDDFSSTEGREAGYAVLRGTVDLGSLLPKIPRVGAPTLVIWGADDHLIPVGLAHRLVRELPDARLELIPDCGHAPNEEQPATTAELLRAHFLG
jgi:pimeloyl-ACP methyl ester carboxylesterase